MKNHWFLKVFALTQHGAAGTFFGGRRRSHVAHIQKTIVFLMVFQRFWYMLLMLLEHSEIMKTTIEKPLVFEGFRTLEMIKLTFHF